MKNWLPFFVSIFLILSCKKDEIVVPKESALPDSIESYQLNPIVEFSSTDSVYYASFGSGCPIAVPVSSEATRELDFNGDSTSSFSIKMKHWYEFLSASNPCANYHYRIYALGLEQNETAGTIDKGEIINSSLNWSSSSTIMRKGGSGYPIGFFDFSDSTYVAVRLKNGGDYNYGWILLTKSNYFISIHKTAFNHTVSNSIVAGQVE